MSEIAYYKLNRINALADSLKAALSENGNPLSTELFEAAFEIKNVVDTFTVRINDKQGWLVVNSSGNNFTLSGNVEMFQVAIGNLIDNSIRYNNNIPRIIINLKSAKDTIVISITDNGKDISKENLSRIFEKFYRIPTGDIHENEGFGLGLYFVKNTVTQMNGTIKVTSTLYKGATFAIDFPVSKA